MNKISPYLLRQLHIILNQIMLLLYLILMSSSENYIPHNYTIHFCFISLFFCDAAYISYWNIKGNSIITHFTYLLLLLGWQFFTLLFEQHTLSVRLSTLLLPICLYQSLYFIQLFVFQESVYRYQKLSLMILKFTCLNTIICFFISPRAFSVTYQIQFILSVFLSVVIIITHWKRILFVIKSQRKEVISSFLFVSLPCTCYIITFHNQSKYLSNMGSYFFVLLAFVSIHNIMFQSHPKQEPFFALKRRNLLFLIMIGITGLIFTAYFFQISFMAVFFLIHLSLFLILIFHLLVYLQIASQAEHRTNSKMQQHFYTYSFTQIKREETLKKEFSNYLHDNILQDLLSIKNLVKKAEQPEIQQLLSDTLGELTTSIRQQMQLYHPPLLRNLTLKENIQALLDSLTEHDSIIVSFSCKDRIFLVEPYPIIIYRMIKELVTNTQKHANATKIQLLLTQEQNSILLKVSDNGTGFTSCSNSPSYPNAAHQGLASIQEQVYLLEGTIIIHAAPNTGTEIIITLPMKGEHSYETFING